MIVSFPEPPWLTVSVLGLAPIVKLPTPELLPPTTTCTTPDESENVPLPGYCAMIWCVPRVEKEVT